MSAAGRSEFAIDREGMAAAFEGLKPFMSLCAKAALADLELGEPNKALVRLWQLVDEHSPKGEQSIACRKGCWFCCAQPVAVGALELLAIANYLRETWSKEAINDLRDRLADYRAAWEVRRDQGTGTGFVRQCPLLQNGSCSVWPVRPFACRSMNSLDATACEQAMNDGNQFNPVAKQMPLVWLPLAARQGLSAAVNRVGLDTSGYNLAIGLLAALDDDAANQRFLNGERVFPEVVAQSGLA